MALSDLPKVLIEIRDQALEKTAKHIGWEVSHQLMYERGGFSVLVKRVAKYEVPSDKGPTVVSIRRRLFRVEERPAQLGARRSVPELARSLLHSDASFGELGARRDFIGVTAPFKYRIGVSAHVFPAAVAAWRIGGDRIRPRRRASAEESRAGSFIATNAPPLFVVERT